MQYGSAGDRDESDPWYGGSSYSGSGRPDLSNTGYMIEALKALDAGANDPAIQRALKFVSRSQNLDSSFNDTQFADKINDGGFYYEIPTEKVDPAESTERFSPNGGLRSYGSMTYTGLKSMIYAGLTDSDPRVKAATKWITDHYSLEQNPGMGDAGLYFYYHTFGAALHARGEATLVDAEGKSHDWKEELVNTWPRHSNPTVLGPTRIHAGLKTTKTFQPVSHFWLYPIASRMQVSLNSASDTVLSRRLWPLLCVSQIAALCGLLVWSYRDPTFSSLAEQQSQRWGFISEIWSPFQTVAPEQLRLRAIALLSVLVFSAFSLAGDGGACVLRFTPSPDDCELDADVDTCGRLDGDSVRMAQTEPAGQTTARDRFDPRV